VIGDLGSNYVIVIMWECVFFALVLRLAARCAVVVWGRGSLSILLIAL